MNVLILIIMEGSMLLYVYVVICLCAYAGYVNPIILNISVQCAWYGKVVGGVVFKKKNKKRKKERYSKALISTLAWIWSYTDNII